MAKKATKINTEKNNNSARKIARKVVFCSVLIVSLWWVFWLGSQCLFMIDVPVLTKWLLSAEPSVNFVSVTIWIIVANLIALAFYHWSLRDYSFLRIKDKWDIAAYVIPLGLITILLVSRSTAFEVPIITYIIAMVATTFCQQLLTFGFMQTALSIYIGASIAAVVTCVMFYLGHFMATETFTFMGITMVAGFILFSWLRFKRGNIYLANAVHVSWALAMTLFF